MSLVQYSQNHQRSFSPSPLPQEESNKVVKNHLSPTKADEIKQYTGLALEAYNNLLHGRYFKDGLKGIVTCPDDIFDLLCSGFTIKKNEEGKFYLTRGLPGGSPIADLLAKLEAKSPTQRSVFISYQWEYSDIVDEIQKEFEDRGFLVIRDKKDLSHGNSLKEFMELINHPKLDYIITVISDSYLKSENCMFEVSQVLQKYKFKDVVLAYVVSENQDEKVKIYNDSDRQKYVDFWKDKLSPPISPAQADKIREIADDLSKFLPAIADKVNPEEKTLRDTKYQPFFDMITDHEKTIPTSSQPPTPIGQKLEKLKDQVLKDEDVQKDLATYIPVLGSRSLFDPKEQTFDLDQAINDFMKGDNKVFLLLGDSGAGKSTYLRYLENRLWKDWTPKKPIPLFISLPALKLPFKEAITEALTERGFNDAEQKDLKSKYSFLFLMDGYDELKQQKNLYEENQLNEWNAQTIITCRTQYLNGEQSCYQNFFTPPAENLISIVSLDEASLSPFTPQQIEAYCRKFIDMHKIPRTWDQYKADIASVLDLAKIIENPFLLRIVAEVLPSIIQAHKQSQSQQQLKLSRIEIFDAFVKSWFNREERRLLRMDTGIKIPDIKKAFAGFAASLALEMEQKDLESVVYEESSDLFEKKSSDWDNYFKSDAKIALVRSGVPLHKIGPHSYAFIHPSLQEYFIARAIINNDAIKTQQNVVSFDNLNKKILTKKHEIIRLLAECVTKDSSLANQFFDIIERSKTDPKASIAAANAITILNVAQVNLSRRNFQGVRIPWADLSQANLTSTNLSHADLRNVQLNETLLDYSTIAFSETEGLELGQKPFIKIPNSRCRAVSADFKMILTGNDDSTVRLWNSQTGKEVHCFRGHSDVVDCVNFSPDGKWGLSGSKDGNVRLWDCQTGKELHSFQLYSEAIKGLTFSPDGKLALTQGENGTTCLFDCQTGKQLHCLQRCEKATDGFKWHGLKSRFSPDGKSVLVASDLWTVCLWDCQTGKQLHQFKGHTYQLSDAIFSPDSKRILTAGSADKTVRLWDCLTGKELHCFQGHSSNVNRVVFSPNGKLALSASHDKTVRLWDCETGKELHCFQGHNHVVHFIAFSPDGKFALSGSNDNTIRLWDCQTGKELYYFQVKGIYSIAFSKDGKSAIIESAQKIGTWQLNRIAIHKPHNTIHSFQVYSKNAFDFSPDRKWALSKKDNTAFLWNCQSGKLRFCFEGHSDRIGCVAISNDGKWALTGSDDCTIRLWDCQTGNELSNFKGHTNHILTVAFSPDGKLALSGSEDGTVRLWDCQNGKQLHCFKGHSDFVNSVAFSPDGKWALSGSNDRTLRLWNCQTGEERFSFQGHSSGIDSVAFSPDGKWALSKSSNSWDGDKTVRIWDCQTGQERHCFKHGRWITSANISSNGKWVLTAGADHAVRLWSSETGKELYCFKSNDYIHNAAFSPDDKWAIFGTDNTVRIWDCQMGKELYSLALAYKIENVSFLKEGKRILVITEQPAIQLWELFDENNRFQPSLQSSTYNATLSAQQLNMEGVKGLSEENHKTLLQLSGEDKN